MAESFYHFSNHRKSVSYLNLPLDTNNKLHHMKEITFAQPRSSSFMTVCIIRANNNSHNIMPSTHGRSEMEFYNSIDVPTADDDGSSVGNISSTSCLTQECPTTETESMTNYWDNQSMGGLEPLPLEPVPHKGLCVQGSRSTLDESSVVTSDQDLGMPTSVAAYMDEEVTSVWSNFTRILIDESSNLKLLPSQISKESVHYGNLKITSRANRKQSAHGKHHPNSCRPTSQCPISLNSLFL